MHQSDIIALLILVSALAIVIDVMLKTAILHDRSWWGRFWRSKKDFWYWMIPIVPTIIHFVQAYRRIGKDD